MEEELKWKAEKIASLLMRDFDVLIKKTKENKIKILYYRPKNLANGERDER